jgi:hypothetical protein
LEGFSVAAGTIWHYRGGRWEATDLTAFDWVEWTVPAVWAAADGEAWATVLIHVKGDREHPPAPKRFEEVLLHWDGLRWRIHDSASVGGRRRFFNDACFQPSGNGWFVGADLSDPNVRRPLAVRHRNHHWEPVALPEIGGPHGVLSDVVCLPGDRAVAIGVNYAGPRQPSKPVLLRYDGEWQRIELPDGFQHAEVGAIAALSDSDVWLAVSSVVAL